MRMTKNTWQTAGALAAATLLAACGGGGGGTQETSPPASQRAAITAQNQAVVADETVSSALAPVETLGAGGVTPKSSGGRPPVLALARRYFAALPSLALPGGGTWTKAQETQTIACSGGGTITVTANDADNNGALSAGDSVAMAFDNCVEPEGRVGGSLQFAVSAYDASSGSMGATLAFNSFSLAAGGDAVNANGTLAMASSITSSDRWSLSLSTSQLTVGGTIAGRTETRQLSDYSATVSQEPSGTTVLTRYQARGDLGSSAISGGSVHFETTTPFTVTGAASTPSSGVMQVTGAGGSALRLTALADGQLQRELDADGNGSFESSTIGAWPAL